MRNRVNDVTRTAVAAIVLVAVLAAFVALTLAGREVDSYIYLLAMMGIPSIASVISARTAGRAVEASEEAVKRTKQLSSSVRAVETHVNGNTTRMMNELESLRADVNEYRQRYGPLNSSDGDGHSG